MNRVNDYFGLESKSDCIWFLWFLQYIYDFIFNRYDYCSYI
ncbi:hypothetical protein [Bacillus phage FI_KG-Lek]|nr:hypothetical protein [Bacillus phage FI_KG-Lek]